MQHQPKMTSCAVASQMCCLRVSLGSRQDELGCRALPRCDMVRCLSAGDREVTMPAMHSR